MADKTVTINIKALLDTSNIKGSVNNIQSALNNLKLPANATKGLKETFDKLSAEVKNFESLTEKGVKGPTDLKKIEASTDRILSLYDKLKSQAKDLGQADLTKLFPPEIVSTINKANDALSRYKEGIKETQKEYEKSSKKLEQWKTKLEERQGQRQGYQDSTKQANADLTAAEEALKAKTKDGLDDIAKAYDEVKAKAEAAAKAAEAYAARADAKESVKKGLQTKADNLQKIVTAYETAKATADAANLAFETNERAISEATKQVEKYTQAAKEAEATFKTSQNEGLENLFKDLEKLEGIDLSKYSHDFEGAKQAVSDFINANGASASGQIEQFISALQKEGVNVDDLRAKYAAYRAEQERFDAKMRDVNSFKTRIQYLFGLTNAVNLVKRAIRSAFETIKELDKAMTETAVVTNFSVSDMWKQLPEYTKRANELGVTTQAAYEAATLFYQQGLNTQQAAELSAETLKMARIAGLDAAEATDRMTNALRGFNMELDSLSAKRVDDVYSQLAAHSASNVDEISTAMTKVASLAHSANMEFETTAAFLAQIIETTRESAETAGTALKTVVARFSEVKKLVDENQLKGQDEEGQTIDVNKVSAALRTAGIDLNKYFLGEVGLDDIFMELASKWDSLTSVQQRYIATQAAGSRQQSRFIALMQDYARTQELVGLAYDSAGASAKQFAKTQESLQSKLAKLKNAWNQFLMGITNSKIVKGVVDALTWIINAVNKLTEVLGNGLPSSILKAATAFLAFKGLKKLFGQGGLVENILLNITGAKALSTTIEASGTSFFSKVVAAAEAFAGIINGGAVTSTGTKVAGDGVATGAKAGFWARLLGKGKSASAREIEAAKATVAAKHATAADKTAAGALLASAGGKTAAKTGAKVAAGAGGKAAASGVGAEVASAAGLSGAAVAAIVVAIIAAVVGMIYNQHYKTSGLEQVKLAEKAYEAQKKAADSQKDVADKQKQAYNAYIENEKAYNTATTAAEKKVAKANMDAALATLQAANPNSVTRVNGQLTLNKQVALEQQEKAEEQVKVGEAAVSFADAVLSSAEAKRAEKSKRLFYDDGQSTVRGNVGGSFWGDIKYVIDRTAALGVMPSREAITEYDTRYNAQQEAIIAERTQESQAAFAKVAETFLQGSYSEEIADLTASAYASAIKDVDFSEQIKERSGYGKIGGHDWWWYRDELVSKYELNHGAGTAKDLSSNELAQINAQEAIVKEQQEMVTKLGNFATTTNGKSLLEALSGVGKMQEMSLSRMNLDTEEGIDSFVAALGITSDTLEQLSTITGQEVGALKQQIATQAKAAKVADQGTKAGIFKTALGKHMTISEELFNNIQDLTPEMASLVASVFDQAAGVMSNGGYIDKFLPELVSMSKEELSKYQSFFNGFNLDDPINAFDQLKEAFDKEPRGTVFKRVLSDIAQTNAAIFNTGNLVQSFLGTLSDDVSQTFEDLIESEGRISAKNIEELSKSCKELDILLKRTEVTAQGLASAFTLFEQSKIPIENLTSELLAALSAGKDFETLLDDVSDWVDDFDAGMDKKKGTEHVVEILDDALEYVSNWEFGNTPLQNIYDHIFGEGAYNEYMKSNYGKKGFDQIEKELTDRLTWAKELGENAGLAALNQLNGKLGISGNGTTFTWDLDQFKSAQEAISAVAKELNVSEGYASSLISSWSSHMWDLGQAWEQLNFDDRMRAYAKEMRSIGDTAYITSQELEVLAEKTGKSVEEIKAAIEAASGKAVIEVTWTDKDGKPLDSKDLISKFDKLVGASTYQVKVSKGQGQYITETRTDYSKFINQNELVRMFRTSANEGIEGIDFNRLKARLLEVYKVPASEVNTVIDKIAENNKDHPLTAEVQLAKWDPDTKTIKTVTEVITATTAEALTAGINAAEKAAEYDLIGQRIAESDSWAAVGANLSDTIAAAGVTGGNAAAKRVAEAVNAVSACITVRWKWDDEQGPPSAGEEGDSGGGSKSTSGTTGGGATRASGGIVSSYAKGSENFHVSSGTALTGEEGPEIVWNKEQGYAYVTGSEGPEFQDLKPGDRVFNASETKRIFKNSEAKGGVVDSFGSGTGGWKPGSGNNSGGSGGDKTAEEWRNDLDWLYNLMEDIAELERQQTKLEEEYEDILSDQTKTSTDLYNLLVQRLANLQTQLEHQQLALEKREQEMREFMDTTNDKDQYLWYNWQDRTLEIDWEAIDKITDQDEYNHIKDLISQAEEIQDKMDDAEDAITDIKNKIQELENIWRDTYVDFEKRVLEALVKSYQEVIDNYSSLSDVLTDNNNKILDAIQKEVSLQRQIRDNTKTEEDLNEKQQRLSYLQRDTTGANAQEILALQKELDQSREDYEDNLIDQAISRLQDDNEASAQQRQQQIEIMQAQLDYQEKNGEFNDEVLRLITGALGADGELLTNSDLYALLTKQENWGAMSEVSKQVWEEELTTTFKEVGAFLLKQTAEASGEFENQILNAVNNISTQLANYSQGSSHQSSGGSGGGGGGSGGGGGYTGGGTTSPVITYGEWSSWKSDGNTYHKRTRDVYENGKLKSPEEQKEKHTFLDDGVPGGGYYKVCIYCDYKEWVPKKGGGGGCFAPGTQILMADYTVKNIEDVEVNDYVIAFDEVNNRYNKKKVIHSFAHYNTTEILDIYLSDKTIITATACHPILTTDGWKSLNYDIALQEHGISTEPLEIGQEVVGINGNAIIENIIWKEDIPNYTTYNITIEDDHTYIANGFVVHNMAMMASMVKRAFATGGLNTQTGPAWLDGTPSEPEYVLNARQTQAFLKLADVLPAAMNNSSLLSSNTNGDIYLDIDMHVDEISDDYDVDRIANRVKDIIYDASSYRNVNTINLMR